MTVHLSTNIFYYLLWLASAALLFISCIRGYRERITQTMSIPFTESMKGLMAVVILLGHYAIRLEGLGLFRIMRSIGLPAVTVFLFISGYCETIQLIKREDSYFDTFISKKIIRIYTPWLVALTFIAFLFRVTNIRQILQSALTFQDLYKSGSRNWFVIFILYCYLTLFIYHLQAKLRKKKAAADGAYVFILTVSALIWFLFCVGNGYQNNWYTNSFTFLLGSIAAANKEKLTAFAKKEAFLKSICLVGVAGILFILPAIVKNPLLVNTIRLLNTLVVSAFVWQASVTCNPNSAVLRFLGKQSLEIFLVGSPFFWFYYGHFSPIGISILWVFGITILEAYIVRIIGSVIANKLNILLKR